MLSPSNSWRSIRRCPAQQNIIWPQDRKQGRMDRMWLFLESGCEYVNVLYSEAEGKVIF